MSKHHQNAGWAGPGVTALRVVWRRAIADAVADHRPLLCGCGCGQPITLEDEWDLGHRVSLAEGGDVSNVWPELRAHNRSNGAHLGNQLRRQRNQRTRKW